MLSLPKIASTAGNTYYVSKTAGSDSNSCTQAKSSSTPKKSIAQGISCLSSGDRLILMPTGTDAFYIDQDLPAIPNGLSADQPTIISGPDGTGATAILSRNTAACSCIFKLGGNARYIKFQRLVFFNYAWWVPGKAYGILLDKGAKDITIVDSGFGAGEGSISGEADFVTVSKNNFTSSGIEAKGDRWLIENNNITWGGVFLVNTANNQSSDRHTIRNNTIAKPLRAGLEIDGSNNLVYNNVFQGYSGFAGTPVKIQGSPSMSANKIYNNDFVDNPGGGVIVGGDGSSSISDTEIKNNIFYRNSGFAVDVGSLYNTSIQNTAVGYNLFYQNGGEYINRNAASGTAFANNVSNQDPLFRTDIGGYRLQYNSPAIERGQLLTAVPTDIDNELRPSGATHDIGIDEFGGLQASPTPTPTPSPILTPTPSPTPTPPPGSVPATQWKTPRHAYPNYVPFTWTPANPTNRQPVQFTNQSNCYNNGGSSVGCEGFSWNFGDGGTSTQQNPVHTYANTGEYNVTEAVTDNLNNTCPVPPQPQKLNASKKPVLWREILPKP